MTPESPPDHLRALLESLFPPGVVVALAGPADADETAIPVEEAAYLEPMAHPRRREFVMGRNTARRALAALGLPPSPIPRDPTDRDPVWPAGTVGSISHSHGVVVAACARMGDHVAIGLDLEASGPLGDDIVNEVCRDDELAALSGAAPPGAADWPKLLFTIKEAGYKAWFPETRLPLEFHAMRITLDLPARAFEASICPADPSSPKDLPFLLTGRFGWTPEFVAAGAMLTRRRQRPP